MVYRGKPSAGCHSCRRRRIKCDGKPEGCSQCSKISIECPGYRNLDDLLWRSENATTVRKAKASYDKIAKRENRSTSSSPNYSTTSSSSSHSSPGSQDLVPVNSHVTLSLEDFGVINFMSSYVPGSHFDYLPKLYSNSAEGSPLRSVVQAAALASFSRDTDDLSLMETARSHYANALTRTNANLRNPALATEDQTLVSVLLLSLFEAMVWDGVQELNNWTTHIMGALSILKLRGQKQFETELGWRLFQQVGNNIRSSCIQNRSRIPPDLRALFAEAKQQLKEDDPRMMLEPLLAELTELSADIKEDALPVPEVLQAAMMLDYRFTILMQLIPDYKLEDSRTKYPEAFGDTVYEYPTLLASQFWSSCRMIRVLLNEIIHGYTPHEPTMTDAAKESLQTQAANTVERMGLDICASVPPILKLSPSSGTYKASANSLLWPLSVVRSASLTPAPVSEYASKWLQYLGDELKLAPIRKALENKDRRLESLSDGLHIFYLT
ncbi:hypothetical protein BU24DRAFT_134378 [Aaosphaeria arxii CBS 175.79]|uniref:Zn(2)-C6 fungal-type domain-containing protein n=1 Tax=Aaosphaeria arxii CBS 175.79 TaxID=1450172 RepID=A0A6A5Y5V3_9PLEO|nr:uncharacterized protein BU24DRAFT_134378 [Aaosphaeria arxii CBS 175.79]KAF2020150.1 hypothetical protein BU24DRAFT_134378 [Aaosphaeria arxii CBS 175.79]